MTQFTIFCLLIGICFNAIGIIYKFFPPKNFTWWVGVGTKLALQNEHTWREANNYAALPSFITATFFIIIAFLPEIVVPSPFLTLRTVIVLLILAGLLNKRLINHHLNKTFDEYGNKKN